MFYLSMPGAMDSGILGRRGSIASMLVSTIGLEEPGNLGNRAGRSISLVDITSMFICGVSGVYIIWRFMGSSNSFDL